MSAESALLAGRLAADALLVDRGDVLRPTGESTSDPNTGAEVLVYDTLHEDVACRLRMPTATPTDTRTGQQLVTLTRAILQTAATLDDLRQDDRVRITASRSPGLVGRVVRIDSPWLQTDSVMCRYPCEESSLPDDVPGATP